MYTCPGTKSGTVVASRGMEVNDSVGKTEVLLQFDGTGAATVREALDTGTQQISRSTLSLDASTSGSPNNTNTWAQCMRAHISMTKRLSQGWARRRTPISHSFFF